MHITLKHISWQVIDSSIVCYPNYTRSKCLRHIGGRGHCRSRDKYGGHAVRSAMAEKPLIRKRHGCIFCRTGVIAN